MLLLFVGNNERKDDDTLDNKTPTAVSDDDDDDASHQSSSVDVTNEQTAQSTKLFPHECRRLIGKRLSDEIGTQISPLRPPIKMQRVINEVQGCVLFPHFVFRTLLSGATHQDHKTNTKKLQLM
jgi:hypothetical protein